ncbi:MAG: amidohydrolase [Clostridioides sp.]|jgi:amidohydrolase|nr:amidohydrolase [Clostridioides sp.]
MEIKKLIEKYEGEMIACRQDLHMHPELSFEEFETTEKIIAVLKDLGIEYRKTEPTGVIADIKGGSDGPIVALRADMDALSVNELNENLSYKSKNEGKMHACGHDSHVSMLLCAAKVLNDIKDTLKGTVRLIFQPAEETAGGAKAQVEQGAMENVDNIFGMHIWSNIPTGKISCLVGSSFAAADFFTVDFKGKGGHGSMPQQCIDTAVMASSFVMNVQSIVSREISPLKSAVVTIGKMEVGSRFNVIAENAKLEGTSRTFEYETRDKVEDSIRKFAQYTATMYGGKANVDYTRATPPVINDKESALLAQKIIKESFGEDSLIFEEPTTGGEDFSYFLEKSKNGGAFALVGCGNPEKQTNAAHHNGKFNVDDDALKYGVELYVKYAKEYLDKQ